MQIDWVSRFCKNIGKFYNEINKREGGVFCGGWNFRLFSKIGKHDFTFMRDALHEGLIVTVPNLFMPESGP